MKHTPTPWTNDGCRIKSVNWPMPIAFCNNDLNSALNGNDTCRIEPAPQEALANAAHIVKCVNLHCSLFEALELLIDNISSEAWESLPPYVEQKVLEAFNAAKDAEATNA